MAKKKVSKKRKKAKRAGNKKVELWDPEKQQILGTILVAKKLWVSLGSPALIAYTATPPSDPTKPFDEEQPTLPGIIEPTQAEGI